MNSTDAKQAFPEMIEEPPGEVAAVQRLASGMANDFNNILQIISGHAEHLLQECDSADQRRLSTQSIVNATRRASVMTRQLQAIAQRMPLNLSDINVSAVVAESVTVVRQHLHGRVRLSTHLGSTLPYARADRDYVVDVLVNLAAYANDHMPHGGTVRLTTDTLVVGPQLQRARPWLRPGRFVRLEVADSGHGIDAEALAHIFEPFSAATARCGSGLELCAVYSAIKQLGGFIWIESEPGQGSRVTILLPLAGDA